MDKLKAAVMTKMMNIVTDPKVMKMLSNPKVAQVVMQGISFKGRAEELLSDPRAAVARQLDLVTREDMERVQDELDDLRARLLEKK